MELGGPVWHVSVAGPWSWAKKRKMALEELFAVGDASLGEWEERGRNAYHVRRRLSPAEQLLVGPVVDIRGDAAEVERRLLPVRHLLPAGYSE